MAHSILTILKIASNDLACSSDTPQLEASILLSHVLNVPRSYFLTWPEKKLTEEEENQFIALVKQRKLGKPIAYIIGQKEFWSLNLKVTPDVLIPHPS